MKRNVTTEKHFKIFKAECERLWKLWGVSGWRLEVRHGEIEGYQSAMGAADSDPSQHRTRIFLPKQWPEHTPVSESELLYTARHEAIHALLGPLSAAAQSRFIGNEELCACEHEVLNVLERALPR